MSNYHDHNEENRSKTRELLVKEKIPFYMDRFEKIVAENGGYFVNGKVCLLVFTILITTIIVFLDTLDQRFPKFFDP